MQCIKGEDGKLQFKGLLPGNGVCLSLSILNKFHILHNTNIGQQLIQLPDGKLHVTSYINQSPSPRTVQISKNTLLSNNNNFTKTGSQVSFNLIYIF